MVGLSSILWDKYHAQIRQSELDLARTAEVGREHAARVVETYKLAVERINDLVDDLPDEEITRSEADLHLKVKKIIGRLPQVQSAYVIDRHGEALLSGTIMPVPRGEKLAADREFFVAMRDGWPDIHISRPYVGRFDKVPFFAISLRRPLLNGEFNGLVNVSANPEFIASSYAKLVGERDGMMALVRADGQFLARYPYSDSADLPLATWLTEFFTSNSPPTSRMVSGVDNIERIYVFRKLEGLPLYVVVGRSTAAIAEAWRAYLVTVLSWGALATFALAGISFFAIWLARQEQDALVQARVERDRRANLEAALRHAERMDALGKLTAGIVHDFNNVLAALGGVLRLASKNASEKQKQIIDGGLDALKRGQALTQQLLSFARQQPLKLEPVDVNKCIRDMQFMVRHMLAERKGEVSVDLDLAGTVWSALTDPRQLELAILNLVANARDAMPTGGAIKFETRNLDEQCVSISVSDTGCGIAADQLSKIFEPFFTTKSEGEGTGLGLSSVYGFAEQSRGKVTVSSEIGIGTTFAIILPRSVHAAATHVPETATVHVLRGSKH